MRSILRYSMSGILLFSTLVSTVGRAATSSSTNDKIIHNDQKQSKWISDLILVNKKTIKEGLIEGFKYFVVPELLLLSSYHFFKKERRVGIGFLAIASGVALGNLGFYIYKNYLRRFFAEIPLPSSLRSDKVIIRHIRSYFQRGGACAWYSVLNAYAIQILVAQNKEITAQSIEDIVINKLVPLVVSKRKIITDLIGKPELFTSLSMDKNVHLANWIGLKNYYRIHADEYGIRWFDDKLHLINTNILYQLLTNNTSIVKHILLSAPHENEAHEVLISIIQRPGEKKQIIYMDSNNTPLDLCSLNVPLALYVSNFIKILVNF